MYNLLDNLLQWSRVQSGKIKFDPAKINLVKNNPFPQTEKPMTNSEKKDWEKEKQKRKKEFYASRDKNKNQRKSNKFVATRR